LRLRMADVARNCLGALQAPPYETPAHQNKKPCNPRRFGRDEESPSDAHRVTAMGSNKVDSAKPVKKPDSGVNARLDEGPKRPAWTAIEL
jgi:hypothetical protein